jgi:hypothetical protein
VRIERVKGATHQKDFRDRVVLEPSLVTHIAAPPMVQLGEICTVYPAEDAKKEKGDKFESMPILNQKDCQVAEW